MRREMIARRFSGAANLGRQHGSEAGREAAKAVLNLIAGAVTLLELLPLLVASTLLCMLAVTALVGLTVILVLLLAPCGPFLIAPSAAFLIAVVYRLYTSPTCKSGTVTEERRATLSDSDAAVDRLPTWQPTSEPPPG